MISTQKSSIRKLIFSLSLFLLALSSFSQSFEGWITYKTETSNPMPDMIPDSVWNEQVKEQFGEEGYMLQKYYYKGSNYISEIKAGNNQGFQAYNPKDGLLYAWEKGSDTAVTLDSRKYMDEFVKIEELKLKDTIMGIPCNSIKVKSKMGEMTLYYNSDYLKVNPDLFKNHIYGHWSQIAKKIGCLPLKVEMKFMMIQMVQSAIAFKEEKIDDNRFDIPVFKEVTASPMN